MLEICYIDNCQLHHDAPNPYVWKGKTMNIQGYRHFYDMTLADHCKFINHIESLIAPWTKRIRRKVGNELPVVWNGNVKVSTPLGTVTVPKSVKLVYDIARYLYEKKGIPANMLGWGGVPGDVKYINGEFISDEQSSMHVQLDRIANRVDPAFAKEVLVEVHGACGGYKDFAYPQPSFFACLAVEYYGSTHTRKVDISNDGDNCKNLLYASKVDKQPLYCRWNEQTHYDVYRYIFKNNKAGRQFKVETLPQNWKGENGIANFKAVAKARRDEYGEPLYNENKYPEPTPIIVDPTIPITPTNLVVVTTKKCGVDKWYQHFKKSLNFKAAFAHLLGKHN